MDLSTVFEWFILVYRKCRGLRDFDWDSLNHRLPTPLRPGDRITTSNIDDYSEAVDQLRSLIVLGDNLPLLRSITIRVILDHEELDRENAANGKRPDPGDAAANGDSELKDLH